MFVFASNRRFLLHGFGIWDKRATLFFYQGGPPTPLNGWASASTCYGRAVLPCTLVGATHPEPTQFRCFQYSG